MNTGIPQEDFELMLTLIQIFHPPGVGARDLRECLLIQLKRDGREEGPRIPVRFRAHGRTSASGVFQRSRAGWESRVEQVQKAANNIAQLDPRPGQIFAEAPQNYVCPM